MDQQLNHKKTKLEIQPGTLPEAGLKEKLVKSLTPSPFEV